VRQALWTGVAILGAVLVQTALGYLSPGTGRLLDPFLLVVVYCALSGGELHGMLAGTAAGWVEDVLFGGRVLGLTPLSKLLVGFAVGLAGRRFLISNTVARATTVFLATLADGLLVPWLASVFLLDVLPLGALALAGRAALNALVGGALYALVERRRQGGLA
jgi:rod shape-determining protein MreD